MTFNPNFQTPYLSQQGIKSALSFINHGVSHFLVDQGFC